MHSFMGMKFAIWSDKGCIEKEKAFILRNTQDTKLDPETYIKYWVAAARMRLGHIAEFCGDTGLYLYAFWS